MAKPAIYRVGEVNAYIKNIFDNDYALRDLSVRGEISNCKYSGQGHIYFSLKDETGSISAVMFKGKTFNGLKFRLEDGQKVVVRGSISIYEVTGRYQLYASEIIEDGIGDLHKAFEESKKRLEEMGMFSPEYKKPIPKYAHKIGIVTASTGAAIQDIINISTRRNPYVQLVLYPAIVQGAAAAQTIVKGIETLDTMGLDTIIVGRGGGSIEDLWCFNEEIVAKAIFDAHTPIISAVGHETDTTIADFVSDLRAPTPSAAAELAVFDVYEFIKSLDQIEDRLKSNLEGKIYSNKLLLDNIVAKLAAFSPKNVVINKRQYLEHSTERLKFLSPLHKIDNYRSSLITVSDSMENIVHSSMKDYRYRLSLLSEKLSAESPLDRISSGYGYIEDGKGKALKSVDQIDSEDLLKIRIKDGTVTSSVIDIERNEA